MTITTTSLGYGQISVDHSPFEDWATQRNADFLLINDQLTGEAAISQAFEFRLSGASRTPGTTVVLAAQRNGVTNDNAFIEVISGTIGIAGVNFGDTDSAIQASIQYDNDTEILDLRAGGVSNLFNLHAFRVEGAVRLGPTDGEVGASLCVRRGNTSQFVGQNQVEFGHGTAGRYNALGSVGNSGFLSFNCAAGSTASTYQTNGLKGSVISGTNGVTTFYTVDLASADNQTPTETIQITATGAVLVGNPAADNGIGTINVLNDLYKNGTVYNDPDYVFEKFFTNEIIQFKDNPGAASYESLPSLASVLSYAKQHLSLPRAHDQSGAFERMDFVLEKIEEIYLYLMDHETRLSSLKV